MINDSVLLNLDGISVKHIEQKDGKYFIYVDYLKDKSGTRRILFFAFIPEIVKKLEKNTWI